LPIFMDRINQDGWAHLISDIAGKSGRRELVEFGREIGLTRKLHRDSTYAEHYDIRGEEIDRAVKAGIPVVSRRKLAHILKQKKVLENAALYCGLNGS
jgi:hypothetical protein